MISWWPSSLQAGPSASGWTQWKIFSLRSVATSPYMVHTYLFFYMFYMHSYLSEGIIKVHSHAVSTEKILHYEALKEANESDVFH